MSSTKFPPPGEYIDPSDGSTVVVPDIAGLMEQLTDEGFLPEPSPTGWDTPLTGRDD